MGPGMPIRLLTALLGLGLSGCLAHVTLERAVMAYDVATAESISRQLLLNIARARHHEPIHFTGVTGVAATYTVEAQAGATPPLGGLEGGLALAPIFGGRIAESPTISIVPIEGAEFTKRLLAPLEEGVLTLLLRQGVDVDLLLRLVAGEFRADEAGEETAYSNAPFDPGGYAVFRRVVAHLSSVQDRNALYVEPILFERSWTMPAQSVAPGDLPALQQQFAVTHDAKARAYRIDKRVTGRIVITNYDPASLSNEERMRLHEAAERNSLEEVTVDVRSGHVGGEYPLRGRFRLRSFHSVLGFLGKAIAEEREYDVPVDHRTPFVAENPVSVMEILESDSSPPGVDRVVKYKGSYYAVRPEKGYQWNKEAFRLLYQIFQMTVGSLPQTGGPAITISK